MRCAGVRGCGVRLRAESATSGGITQKELGKLYGVDQQRVSMIVRRLSLEARQDAKGIVSVGFEQQNFHFFNIFKGEKTMGKNYHTASAKHIDRADVLLLLNAARAAGAELDRLMILVAFNYGARASEVCQMRTTDVDMVHGIVRVHRLKGRKEKSTLQRMTENGGSFDDRQALTEWIAKCVPGSLLFPICRQHFFTRFREHAQAAGLPPHLWRIHNLRHGRAMSLVNKIPPYELGDFMGHSSIGSTSRYLNASQADIWRSVDAADSAA
jgi:integrase